MNKIDGQWYRYLKALSKIPRDYLLDKYKTKHIKNIKEYMEGTTWDELYELGYVNSNPNVKQILTPSGLEQLRMLEDMRRKDLTLVISTIAIVLSTFAFSKSMGWI
ncbi:MAG: hypothetical protein ABH873_06170 [Candidatus Firestonebacteria bacterium]